MSIESLVLVANDKGGTISTLRVEGKRFARVAVSEVGAGCGTFAVDRANDLVYAATRTPHPAILTLRLDRETGALTEVARREVSDPVAYLTLVHDTLLAASYHGDWGASYPVADGVVGDPATTLHARRMHAAVVDPRGENAYFVSLGDDLIAQRAVAVDSELVELSEPAVHCTPASGPRHLVSRVTAVTPTCSRSSPPRPRASSASRAAGWSAARPPGRSTATAASTRAPMARTRSPAT